MSKGCLQMLRQMQRMGARMNTMAEKSHEAVQATATVTAIVGANWGDEGKGKTVDYFAQSADVVVRFQGGSNAGHTIINEHGKFVLHLLPSGVFYPQVVNVLGPGVAVNMRILLQEIRTLTERGLP